jgi:hypothetical protein
MRCLLLTIFFINAYSINAQYVESLKLGNQWSVIDIRYIGYGYPDSVVDYYTIYATHDSTFMGTDYVAINSVTGSSPELFREDSSEQKIYKFLSPGSDTLLLDFSVSIGDTLTDYWLFSNFKSWGFELLVNSIDTIPVGNELGKKITIVTNTIPPTEIVWIEGIGMTTSFLGGSLHLEFPYERRLVCARNISMDSLYLDLRDWYDCDSVLIDIITPPNSVQESSLIEYHITSVGSNLVIDGPQSHVGQTMAIYDLYGKLAHYRKIDSYPISMYMEYNGIYIVALYSKEKLLYRKKIAFTKNSR